MEQKNMSRRPIEYKSIDDCPQKDRMDYLRKQNLAMRLKNANLSVSSIYNTWNTKPHFLTCPFCDAVVKVPTIQTTLTHTNGSVTHPGEML